VNHLTQNQGENMNHRIVRIHKILAPKVPYMVAENEIERLANLILKNEGCIQPLLLKRIGVNEEYHILSGYLVFMAAKKASSVDNRKGRFINAFIAESDEEARDFLEQQKLLQRRLDDE
jgi:hypothetical protein